MSAPDLPRPLAIAVVGCGGIAQVVHLPLLAAMPDRFAIVAVCDASEQVARQVAARYGARAATDHRALLAPGGIDAVLVATPPELHAAIVIDALEAGAHVLCEKPAAILVDDVERMIAARDRAGRIVQIGTMKRFDPAVEAACADAAHDDPADLLYVSVVAHDSEAGPYVDAAAIARGPVPAAAAAAARAALLAQVEAAVGDAGPETLAAFVDGYLGSLVHHVDLVHALLAAGGEALPARVVGGAAWAGGTAVQGSCVLASGARWDTTWVQTLDLHEHEERTIVVGRRAISRLVLPSPWLQRAASVYERSWSDGERRLSRGARGHDEAYARQLRAFADAVHGRAAPRATLEDARLAIGTLTAMFQAAERR